MPSLDRTWYNTLVNDDGSGLTGSVWDKDDVNQLMNASDTAIAGTEPGWVSYTPSLAASAGVWSSPGAHAKYRLEQYGARQVTLLFSIEASTLSAAATELRIGVPLSPAAWGGTYANACVVFVSGSNEGCWATIAPGASVVTIVRNANQAFPAAGGLYVRGQILYHV